MGKIAFPPWVLLPQGEDYSIPCEQLRGSFTSAIPYRLMKPSNGNLPKAIFMHIHGGGFVLGSCKMCDAPSLTLSRWIALDSCPDMMVIRPAVALSNEYM